MRQVFDRAAAANRLARIRLSVREIGRLAGVHYDAVHKLLNGSVDARSSTITKVMQALVQEELALRDYLNALHPPVSAGAIAIAEAQAGVLPDPLAGRRLEAAE